MHPGTEALGDLRKCGLPFPRIWHRALRNNIYFSFLIKVLYLVIFMDLGGLNLKAIVFKAPW